MPERDFNPLGEIRHLLNTAECAEADRLIRVLISERTRQSHIFKAEALDVITESILVLPAAGDVIMNGPPAGLEENRRLGLGGGMTVGAAFSETVSDLHGVTAIHFVGQIFAQFQTQHRCTMLRILGARNDAAASKLKVRLHAAETSCVDSLDCDGQVFALSELPLLPLPGCLTRQCPCSLELIDENHRQADRPDDPDSGRFRRAVRILRKNR
jgi:hypothetical protein